MNSDDRSRLRYLLKKFADNSCTVEEFTECTGYFNKAGKNEVILEWMEEEWQLLTGKELPRAEWEQLYPVVEGGLVIDRQLYTRPQTTQAATPELTAPSETTPAPASTPAIPVPASTPEITATAESEETETVPRIAAPWWKYAAAAAIILLLGGYFYWRRLPAPSPKQEYAAERFRNDIPAPTGTHTILQLANGTQIVLDSAQNGRLTREGNAEISKAGKDQLVYQSLKAAPEKIFYNTLSTAKGGRTSLVLPDGTKVWLNALSSLRFPTAFTGKERVVEITGEAYFEVAKNPAQPFTVKISSPTGNLPAGSSPTGNEEVQVLGTNFNVMAYADEPVTRTTLLEGSVKLVNGARSSLLSPGQQGRLDVEKDNISVTAANVEQAIAWKNNLFWFDNTDMVTIMRQMSRWYDVNIVFEGKVAKHFTGTIPKDVSISTLLKVMELSGGVHFTIDGKRIGVME